MENLQIGISKQARVLSEAQEFLSQRDLGFDSFDRTDRKVFSDRSLDFIGVKGMKQIEFLLSQGLLDGMIIGSDIAQEVSLRTDQVLNSLLDTGGAPCRLAFLAPQKYNVRQYADLRKFKTLVTKYPEIVRNFLQGNVPSEYWKDLRIQEVESGADAIIARVKGVLAVDIVGTGETARKCGLEVLSEEKDSEFVDILNVSLQVFSVPEKTPNVQQMFGMVSTTAY